MSEAVFSYPLNSVVSFLRDNLTDYNSVRKATGKNWVFPTLPDVTVAFPQVSVIRASGFRRYREDEQTGYNVSGRKTRAYFVPFQITVWVKSGEEQSAIKNGALMDKIASDIENAFITLERTLKTTYSLHAFEQDGGGNPLPDPDTKNRLLMTPIFYHCIYYHTIT